MASSTIISPELLRMIVCPHCRQALALYPNETALVSLRCTGCGNHYPILDGIPILLMERATKEAPSAR